MDSDAPYTDGLIDRFAVDITDPIGTTSERHTYSGVFQLADIDLSIKVVCESELTGEFCVEPTTSLNTTDNITTSTEQSPGVAGTSVVIPVIVAILCLVMLVVVVVVTVMGVSYKRTRTFKSSSSHVVRYSRGNGDNPMVSVPGSIQYSSLTSQRSNISVVSLGTLKLLCRERVHVTLKIQNY